MQAQDFSPMSEDNAQVCACFVQYLKYCEFGSCLYKMDGID